MPKSSDLTQFICRLCTSWPGRNFKSLKANRTGPENLHITHLDERALNDSVWASSKRRERENNDKLLRRERAGPKRGERRRVAYTLGFFKRSSPL